MDQAGVSALNILSKIEASNSDMLKVATSVAAKAYDGLEHSVFRLGMRADVLFVEGTHRSMLQDKRC